MAVHAHLIHLSLRVGDVIILVVHGGFGGVDPSFTETAARTAVAKVARPPDAKRPRRSPERGRGEGGEVSGMARLTAVRRILVVLVLALAGCGAGVDTVQTRAVLPDPPTPTSAPTTIPTTRPTPSEPDERPMPCRDGLIQPKTEAAAPMLIPYLCPNF
jgi:hypothetical protein